MHQKNQNFNRNRKKSKESCKRVRSINYKMNIKLHCMQSNNQNWEFPDRNQTVIEQLNTKEEETIPLVGPPTMMTATTLSSELPITSSIKTTIPDLKFFNNSCLFIHLCMCIQTILNCAKTKTTTLKACDHWIQHSNNKKTKNMLLLFFLATSMQWIFKIQCSDVWVKRVKKRGQSKDHSLVTGKYAAALLS